MNPKTLCTKNIDDIYLYAKSKIEEIRALYEDGIITKEEMLDLIKNSK